MNVYQNKPHFPVEQDREHVVCACGHRIDIFQSEKTPEGYMGMIRRFSSHLRQMSEGKETRG